MFFPVTCTPQPLYFYQPSGHLLDPHSFPTRRSSDLSDGGECWDNTRGPAATQTLTLLGFGWQRDRSEEHTSELQSPMYLVCRLLLEKKKRIRQSRPGDKTYASQVARRPCSLLPCECA